MDPDYVDALQGLAMAYSSKEAYENAIAVGKHICELTPDDVIAHASLAMFFQQQGRVAEARTESAMSQRLLDREQQPSERRDQS